jgi:methylenetetrahydrofolate dehydrogenase (NADP+)/methenyltetrahydrofolate cyclohydrolase
LTKRKPCLAFVLVGEDPASEIYVKMKKQACERVGIKSLLIALKKDVKESLLLEEIKKLNQSPNVDGILVQFPLPPSFDKKKVVESIDPEKDVDGFHPLNLGKLVLGDESGFFPCTPWGILTMLMKIKISTQGKHVVVVGRSIIVGKPLACLLMQNRPYGNATVTIAHSLTKNLAEITKTADILIAAVGKPKLITKDMVKKGAVVIDVGINRSEDGSGKRKIVGDVDFENVSSIVSAITPVPKGVGPMTVAMLLANCVKSFLRKKD